MGITQQKKGVATIKEIINLLLLRGNIGKPGAGASPIRGHSNVQGDRTMGIWEQMPQSFMEALGKEFDFEPPREHGTDAVETINQMRAGVIKVFVALGGNLVAAISDTNAAEAAMENTEMTVQISTKLNRSHTVIGREALILPTMGRTEIDIQESGPQFVSVEDTVCAVHPSWGSGEPVSHHLLSEPAIVSRLGKLLVGDKIKADWNGFEKNYNLIRDHISRVVGRSKDYNQRIRQDGGFVLAKGPRDSRTFPTPTGKAVLTVNDLEHVDRPEGTLILQSMRSHDQFNTTIYSHNDRYRGIKKGRHVVFVNPDDIAELGLADGQYVDIRGVHEDGEERVVRKFRVVSYPRHAAARPPTTPRPTCSSRSTTPPRAATPRSRRPSLSGSSPAWIRRPTARLQSLPGWPRPRHTRAQAGATGNVQPRPRPLDITPPCPSLGTTAEHVPLSAAPPHRTCPAPAPAAGHNTTMPIPGHHR